MNNLNVVKQNKSLLIDTFLSVTSKNNKQLHIFWAGFMIYTLAWTVTKTTQTNYIVFQSFQIFGILLFVPSAIKLFHWKFESNYLRSIFGIYCFCTFTIIIRGFLLNYDFLKIQFLDAYEGIFQYLLPLVILFPKTPIYLRITFKVIVVLSAFYIVYTVIFINDILYFGSNVISQAIIEYFSKTLSIPCGFLLLTYIYHTKKINLFAIIIILVTLLFAIIRARRGLILMSLNIFIIAFIIYFYNQKFKFTILAFLMLIITVIYWQGSKIYNENKNGLFSYMTERLDEGSTATRDGVEASFYKDMTIQDWIIGKGINGSYYCPDIDESDYRTGIETDYLSIILKGGIISLGLLLLITIPAIFKGIFYSRNILSKASGIWILFYLFDLYPAPVTDFTLNYLLVWVSIGICYSKSIRNIPERTLVKTFAQ
jgi:hypothetical protein